VESRDTKSDWTIEDSWQAPGVMRYAIDPERAERLWSLSEQLVGLGTHETA
jgi:hypothetical protein